MIAMVKANAYGHGLVDVARTLAPEAFGVARLEEGLILRNAQISQPVILMEGCPNLVDMKVALDNGFEMVIHAPYQVDLLLSQISSLSPPAVVWIKLNTGMNRLGFTENTWSKLIGHPQIKIKGFMTHFACADEPDATFTLAQKARFDDLLSSLNVIKSAANSAAILNYPNTHYDWVRPGLMLYGASPFANQTGHSHGLKPVMKLTTQVIALHSLAANEYIGYGATFKTSQATQIAIAAIGYGDGYPWSATHQTPIIVNNQRARIVGRVAMDMIAIDITSLTGVQLGDEVECWGPQLPIEQVAQSCHTIAYELMCRLTSRVQWVHEA